jgi:hypothetical protein
MKKKKVANSGKGLNTHISVVIDRSGSMGGIRADTIGGFNTFLKEQKEVKVPTTITYAQFDYDYNVVHRNLDIQEMPELNEKTYCPRGSTALLDAIGRSINETKQSILEGIISPDQVIFVIITDGEENTSREFSNDQIKKMIDAQTEKKWDFVYLGANQDSFAVGGGLGMARGSTMNYMADSEGVRALYGGASVAMASTRMAHVAGETQGAFFSQTDGSDEKKPLKDGGKKLYNGEAQ